MLKKISFLIAVLLATTLSGIAQAEKEPVQCHKNCPGGCNPDGSCR